MRPGAASGGGILYMVPDLRHPVRWAEWFAQRLARVTGASSGGGHRSRWRKYHTYLRASRQWHRVRWWLAASGSAGLCRVPLAAAGVRSSLWLLAFRRADERTDEPLAPHADESGTEQGTRQCPPR